MKGGVRRFLTPFVVVLASLQFGFALPQSGSVSAGEKEFYLNSAGLELLGGANKISIAPGLNFRLLDWMQAGGSIEYESVAFGDDSLHVMTLTAGLTFDLGGAYNGATFLFLGLAHRSGNGIVSDTANNPGGTGLAFFVGRRIPMSPLFSYRPSVGVQMIGKTSFVINALALSYFF
jgi:hypothetical protein